MPDFTAEEVLRGLASMVARRDAAALTALHAVLRPEVCDRRLGDLQRLRPHAIGYDAGLCDRLTVVLYGEPTAAFPHPHRPGTAGGGTPI